MSLEPPFGRCDSYAAVVSAVLHAPPVLAPSGYSNELSEALQLLLARKPHQRPSNRELLRSLLREAFHDFLHTLEAFTKREALPSPSESSRQSRHSLEELQLSRSPSTTPFRAASVECSYPSDFESESSEDFSKILEMEKDHSHLHGDHLNTEWRQLLAEAEALLVPLPEIHWGEETQKLRSTRLASEISGCHIGFRWCLYIGL